jgi:hypothetical protein
MEKKSKKIDKKPRAKKSVTAPALKAKSKVTKRTRPYKNRKLDFNDNPWLLHVQRVRMQRPDLSYKEALKYAKATYEKSPYTPIRPGQFYGVGEVEVQEAGEPYNPASGYEDDEISEYEVVVDDDLYDDYIHKAYDIPAYNQSGYRQPTKEDYEAFRKAFHKDEDFSLYDEVDSPSVKRDKARNKDFFF